MVERITGRKIPGTGIAFGFDRTLEALEMNSMLPDFKSNSKILITVFSPELINKSIEIAKNAIDIIYNNNIKDDFIENK